MLRILLLLASLAFAKPSHKDHAGLVDLGLMGADLLDECLYELQERPLWAQDTALVLAYVHAPIGVSTSFRDVVENRLWEYIHNFPQTKFHFVHCPLCQEWMITSSQKETRVEPGDMQIMFKKDETPPYALGLHFEVVKDELVLFAQVFETSPPQKIFWAKRFTISRFEPAILQNQYPLLSLEEARKKQKRMLEKSDPLQVVTRLVFRNYNNASSVPPIPMIEQSIEGIVEPWGKIRASLNFGVTSLKSAIEAWQVGGQIAVLDFTQDRANQSQIDTYGIIGVNYMRMRGPMAAPFSQGVDALTILEKEPRASVLAVRYGIESHIKYRFGAMLFAEYLTSQPSSDLIKKESFIFPYHLWGMGILIKW